MRPRIWSRSRIYPARAWAVPLIIAVALAAWSIGWFDGRSAQVAGHAQAIDGDTLRIGEQRVRLVGLDAPELEQTCTDGAGDEWRCGIEARAFLAGLLKGKGVTCSASGQDGYGRTLASCAVDGGDLGEQLVAGGWAISDVSYPREEETARAAKLGIWSGAFITPAAWRRSQTGGSNAVWEWIRSWFQ